MPVDTPKFSQRHNKYYHYSANYYSGRLLYWVLLFIVISSLGSLPFIYVDVSVQSKGVVITKHKTSTVSAPITAKVVQVNIVENKHVNLGDTLLVLDHSGLNNALIIHEEQVVLQARYVKDLNRLLANTSTDELSSPLYRQEQRQYNKDIVNLRRNVSQSQLIFERTSNLYSEGVVSHSVFQTDSFKLQQVRDELSVFKSSTLARWESENRNYTLAIHELNTRIEDLRYQISQCYLIAPFDGNVIDFNGIAEGGFMPENELIAKISPIDDLFVRCYVSPTDIGLIQEKMPVFFQVDAYNYNQWSLLSGEVYDIANDVTLYKDQYVYLIDCVVNKEYLQLKSGVKGHLKKGMSLTGRFVVTKRSLFQLLFDNVDDWINPKVIK